MQELLLGSWGPQLSLAMATVAVAGIETAVSVLARRH
jgi:hypothetical protein